ncbi:MAG: RNA-binding protein [Planctomycetes bacterium]|nr:RNA-binding protein [Planctomycetota bacterium]
MGSKLYVGNIPFNATEEDLRRIFGEGGRSVTEVQIMQDRYTGRSRGFAFVTMGTDQEAFDATQSLNGAMLGGRPMRVNEAQDRPAFQPREGGGGGGFRRHEHGGGGGGHRGGGGGGGFRRGGGGSGGGHRDDHGGGFRNYEQ